MHQYILLNFFTFNKKELHHVFYNEYFSCSNYSTDIAPTVKGHEKKNPSSIFLLTAIH
jgi:hypothetical protein